MDSGLSTMRNLLQYVDREAAIWAAALIVLALGNPNSDFHFTIFWPYYVWGIKSPGYGLGHSISYRNQRKDETTILLFTLIGFVVIAGIQRFVLGHIGLGILYLLTAGLCFIGTIVDAINHKKLAAEYNVKTASQIAMNLGSGMPPAA